MMMMVHQALDVRTRSVGDDRLAMLRQALRSGANPNFTCQLLPLPDSVAAQSPDANADANADADDGDLNLNHLDLVSSDHRGGGASSELELELGDSTDSAADTMAKASFSALHVACSEGLHEAAEALLLHRADAGAHNDAGLTPLHLAAMHGHGMCINALVEGGAAAGRRRGVGGSNSNARVARAVAELVNARTWMGETPLFYAVQQGFADATEQLLRVKVGRARRLSPW